MLLTIEVLRDHLRENSFQWHHNQVINNHVSDINQGMQTATCAKLLATTSTANLNNDLCTSNIFKHIIEGKNEEK